MFICEYALDSSFSKNWKFFSSLPLLNVYHYLYLQQFQQYMYISWLLLTVHFSEMMLQVYFYS